MTLLPIGLPGVNSGSASADTETGTVGVPAEVAVVASTEAVVTETATTSHEHVVIANVVDPSRKGLTGWLLRRPVADPEEQAGIWFFQGMTFAVTGLMPAAMADAPMIAVLVGAVQFGIPATLGFAKRIARWRNPSRFVTGTPLPEASRKIISVAQKHGRKAQEAAKQAAEGVDAEQVARTVQGDLWLLARLLLEVERLKADVSAVDTGSPDDDLALSVARGALTDAEEQSRDIVAGLKALAESTDRLARTLDTRRARLDTHAARVQALVAERSTSSNTRALTAQADGQEERFREIV